MWTQACDEWVGKTIGENIKNIRPLKYKFILYLNCLKVLMGFENRLIFFMFVCWKGYEN